ncbi:NADH-quinone oxidoreductase subunit C [Uliginosibacterium sp. H3]|uniref:NADH-quinone oxidoreductase subunit C n=1 Tax=Uliginosibacterium silvisoli TaxID=3114758 RepID=A0ABU6K5Q0_9RHOO|nr:NADH-quinone oxidoreductase subunit C [Uliginosibacterium sp. H3]
MSSKLERLIDALNAALEGRGVSLVKDCGEVTLEVCAADYLSVAELLRDAPTLRFEQLIDLSGIDYASYAGLRSNARRYAAVLHLLSVSHNWRVRLRVHADDDAFPVVASVVSIWPSANWFEREAFDLYGIMFEGHPDLRRILTDYGFVGHPFRKDFPVSGYMEMRYDPEQGRVIYQPVTIAPREVTPRIVREESYGDVGHG